MNLSWAYASNPVKEGNVITGHVIEKGSEAGIAYATVLIVETGKGTVTNDEGYFRFKDIPAGEYTLKVQMMGYTTQTKKVTVSKEFTVDMHFVMEEDVIQVDEVVVSANRNETSRKLAPVVVNVMNNRLFEIVNSTDLAKSLNYQSGLRVENNCQNCGFPQVRINGLEGPYSQILINSRPVMSALSSRIDEFITTSPRIKSFTCTSSSGSILKRTTYCLPSAISASTSSLGIVSELRICMRVEASYWKLAISARLASSSCGVSKAIYALPASSNTCTYFLYMSRRSD
jgi:outer membrane receptor for ferrienterochelin and colicins